MPVVTRWAAARGGLNASTNKTSADAREIRNPNFEIRNNCMIRGSVIIFIFSLFQTLGPVSSFGFRASNLFFCSRQRLPEKGHAHDGNECPGTAQSHPARGPAVDQADRDADTVQKSCGDHETHAVKHP